MSIYAKRVEILREKMRRDGIDAYLILTDDFHASEYVDAYFMCRGYISGFTGSAGVLVVTLEEADLWTDGRYFLQAADQLEGSGIILQKMGEPGVPTVTAFLADKMQQGQCLGYDGRTVNAAYAETIKKALASKEITYAEQVDLVGEMWTDRPPFPAAPIWLLGEEFSGESRASKLSRVREEIQKAGADAHLLASLDDIAWILNFRGNDIAYCPEALSYFWITAEKAILYIATEAVSDEIREALAADGVEQRPYLQIYKDLPEAAAGAKLLIDRNTVNVALVSLIPESAAVLDKRNPSWMFKALKNETEMKNERIAHIQDGVAVTKMIYWLKQVRDTEEFRDGKVSELSCAAQFLEFRKERPHFIEQSFEPIIATGAHGAIVHYDPTEETNVPVEDNTFLLMDTGGHYLEGTTDITRTVAIGELSDEQKRHYTAVLRGHLNLAAARFKYGCTGANLDILARAPLWELGLDYNHGTGHGVGYLLNVHEGPQSIRLRDINGGVPFAEGMLTSDEPGLYLAGKYGIRIENLMLCHEECQTEMGKYMNFEPITMVPYERDAILKEEMTAKEIALLNAYHQAVYEAVSPYLTEAEREWLREVTSEM